MANVFIQKGLSHDPDQGGMFMRMCITTSKTIVKEAIDRLASAFAQVVLPVPREPVKR